MRVMWQRTLVVAPILGLFLVACAPVTGSVSAPPSTPIRGHASTTAPNTSKPAIDLSRVDFAVEGWKTDFSKHSVPLEEINAGGPPRDGIPPIDRPKFESVQQASSWLRPQEPVLYFSVGRDSKAYPLQILIWHEIVNDELGNVPVVLTFCPLCNTAIAFDRRMGGRLLDFGTTGNLRHSDLVMWDRQTESWWQQITGEAIVGELVGNRLRMLPASIISWEAFRLTHPQGRVLSRDTGHRRDYGLNPYIGYDQIDQPPFLFTGKHDGRLPPMERVVTVSLADEDAAYPFGLLRQRRVVADTVGGQPIVVFFQSGTSSALDGSVISTSRDIGGATVYVPEVDGRRLTFTWQEDAFVDAETGSRWNLLGQATSGLLAGKHLQPVVHANHFWFAWAAFKPKTRIAD